MVGARSSGERRGRRRLSRRLLAIGALLSVVAVAAGVGVLVWRGGVTVPGESGPDPHAPVRAFTAAWVAGDYRTMYRQLTPGARAQTPYAAFRHAYERDAALGSLRSVRVTGPGRLVSGRAIVPVTLRTALFGRLHEEVSLPLVEGRTRYQIAWQPQLAWPGLTAGDQLARTAHAPDRRGAILAANHMVLARGFGAEREYPQGTPFYYLTGFLRGPQTKAARRRRVAEGWPADSLYGQGGLEQSVDSVLGGEPRIDLVAQGGSGDRLLAKHPGRRPHDVETTLDASLQTTATDALAGRLGGIVIMDAHTGAVRAAAGIALDATQPPGSTFKIVTASAALTAGVVSLDSTYTPERYVDLGGFRLPNFHHELCGGTLVQAFAQSCNSVFAPVADKTGGKRLAAMAERFGFNAKPTIEYPVHPSAMPAASELTNIVNLGVAGIGQGGVTATPLQMASVGQVIAGGGVERPPWIVRRPGRISDRVHRHRVISGRVAGEVAEMMRAVVAYGTGTAASSALATVNGKTGTAEVGPGIKTDAWFVGYAPAEAPRVVVSVLIVHGGVGGETAAPIARAMIDAALG